MAAIMMHPLMVPYKVLVRCSFLATVGVFSNRSYLQLLHPAATNKSTAIMIKKKVATSMASLLEPRKASPAEKPTGERMQSTTPMAMKSVFMRLSRSFWALR